MKILITGGAGFIGTNVCIEASRRNHKIVCFDNFVRPMTEENIETLKAMNAIIIRGDVRNKIDLDKLPWIPDAIIHLAGQCGIPYSLVSPYYDFEVNTLGTLNILEYSRLHGNIPVALASSNKAYTNITNMYVQGEETTRYVWMGIKSLDEEVPLDAFGKYARTPYGTSKVSADLYCQEYYQCFGTPTVVNRMSCIYGYYQKGVEDQAWVDWFMRAIAFGNGKINIFGTGKQVRDMLFGKDCAKLYLDEVENIDKVKGKAYNIGGGTENTMSLLEAIAEIESISGKKAELTFLPKRHGDQDIWISNIGKIENDLGWKPTTTPQEGIKLMFQAHQIEHGII